MQMLPHAFFAEVGSSEKAAVKAPFLGGNVGGDAFLAALEQVTGVDTQTFDPGPEPKEGLQFVAQDEPKGFDSSSPFHDLQESQVIPESFAKVGDGSGKLQLDPEDGPGERDLTKVSTSELDYEPQASVSPQTSDAGTTLPELLDPHPPYVGGTSTDEEVGQATQQDPEPMANVEIARERHFEIAERVDSSKPAHSIGVPEKAKNAHVERPLADKTVPDPSPATERTEIQPAIGEAPISQNVADEMRPTVVPPADEVVPPRDAPIRAAAVGANVVIQNTAATRPADETSVAVRSGGEPDQKRDTDSGGFRLIRTGRAGDDDILRFTPAETSAARSNPVPIAPSVSSTRTMPEPGSVVTTREVAQVEPEQILPTGQTELEEVARTQAGDRARPEPVAARSIINQVIHSVSRAPGDGVFEVRLQPEELGRVRLAMTTTEAGLSVQVTVERAETLDLIRRNIDMFESDLRGRGFDAFSFSFGGEDRGSDSDQSERQAATDKGDAGSKTGRDTIVELDSAPVAIVTDRLDIRV